MEFVSNSAEETQKIAVDLSKNLKPGKHAQVIALEGELGAGKTTFVQGFGAGLGIEKNKIKSPTFVLMKNWKLKNGKWKMFYHLDCYRLRDHDDLKAFDLKEIFTDPKNIILIEWAERVNEILPAECVKIHIDHTGKGQRKITIN